MNIINSDIISTNYDIFWQEAPAAIKSRAPRPVLVITHSMAEGSTEQLQLQKMLEASKLTPEQYNIVTLEPGERMAWHSLRSTLTPGVVFLIGIAPQDLGVAALFRMNEPNRYNDTIWLPTISIKELEQMPEIKKQLWVSAMKPVFVDKIYGELALGIVE